MIECCIKGLGINQGCFAFVTQLKPQYLFRLLANKSCTPEFARYFQYLCITTLYKTIIMQSIACLPRLKEKAKLGNGAGHRTKAINSVVAFMEDKIISHFMEQKSGKSFDARFERMYYSRIVLQTKLDDSAVMYAPDSLLDDSNSSSAERNDDSREKESDEFWESASTFDGPTVSGFESDEEGESKPAYKVDITGADSESDGEASSKYGNVCSDASYAADSESNGDDSESVADLKDCEASKAFDADDSESDVSSISCMDLRYVFSIESWDEVLFSDLS